ncbi:MAG: hypothetical protein K8T25_12510 [Planctomycetia bacterium]|nr:hypothetical protein [Planctomycetia bacterium]
MPPAAHVIRLREPWIREPHPQGMRFRRRFNCPTGLGPQDKVWLVVEAMPNSGAARCNAGEPHFIAAGQPTQVDITAALTLHNEICIELGDPDSNLGAVHLEIRPGNTEL